MKRVVLDTNVFVSMILGGEVSKIHTAWRAKEFHLIVSDEILAEYLDVLNRPKFHLSSQTISIIVARVYREAKFVIPLDELDIIKDDPSDNKFIEAALTGNADYIVSGDKHVLNVQEKCSIPIVTARNFIQILGKTD